MGHGVTVLQEEGCLPFWFVSRQACQLVVMATALHCRCLRHTKHTPKSHKVFFVDLLQPDSGSLSLQLNQCHDGMARVYLGSRKSRRITAFLSQKTVRIFYLLRAASWTFSLRNSCSMDCCFDTGSKFWQQISSPVMMGSRKPSLSALRWIPGHNSLIHTDVLFETLFISWRDSCVHPSGM